MLNIDASPCAATWGYTCDPIRNWVEKQPACPKQDWEGKPIVLTRAVGIWTTLARSRWFVARDTIISYCERADAEAEIAAPVETMLDS
jgi:hypothetical protein